MRIEDEDKDQIALASEILGERQLRKELSAMNPAYKNKNKPVLQVISVAASIALIVGIYFGFFNRGNEEIQEMIIDKPPVLMDSASYKFDSTKYDYNLDSIND